MQCVSLKSEPGLFPYTQYHVLDLPSIPLKMAVSASAEALSRAQELLLLRRHREALQKAAASLNALACPASPPSRLGSPQADTATAELLPPLLPLPDDASLLARSAGPMSVLLQAACEIGHPQLASEALASCYVDLVMMPYTIVWLGSQAP